QQRQDLDVQKQQYDQYNKLSELASNPRNFVESFFRHRGFQPPADVARYSNQQPMNQGTTFQDFLQRQGLGTQLQAQATRAQQAQSLLPAFAQGTFNNPATGQRVLAPGNVLPSTFQFSPTMTPEQLAHGDRPDVYSPEADAASQAAQVER